MRLFTCSDFVGHWPVGTAAVILASNPTEAKRMLLEELEKVGLKQRKDIAKSMSIEEIKLTRKQVVILHDGDY